MLCKLLAVKEISPVPHRVYIVTIEESLVPMCCQEIDLLFGL